jgi:hypothetical protein
MTKYLSVPLACLVLAVSGLAAAADQDEHRVQHGPKNPRDPNFNPMEYPLCYVWDMQLKRNVWICGRSAY